MINHVHSLRLFFSLFFSVFTTATVAFATTGGQPTSESIHSSIVNIVFEKTICSGVVIGPKTILTAAHCGDAGGAPLVVAFIQPDVTTSECNKQTVEEFTYEPSAVKTRLRRHTPDLLLLKLTEPLCDAKIASLDTEPVLTDEIVSLAGHGKWEFGHAVSTEIDAKLIDFDSVYLHVNAATNPLAKKMIERFLEDGPQNYLFAIPETENSSMCPGDSGGPVYNETEEGMLLKGINGLTLANEVLGSKKCGYAYVQAFTPIAPYLDWINEKLIEWN